MQKRTLGKNGLEVSAIGLGCMGMSWSTSYGPKLERLEENLGALNIKLTANDLSDVETASSHIKIEGTRYPEFSGIKEVSK